jgi:nitrite reductase/ring-hydroxylating ferredoxin subunit
MAGGLAASYGTFAYTAGRFLYPDRESSDGWLFVTYEARMRAGDSLAYRAPNGAPITIARIGASGESRDFLALSSTCPHLGCQVRWEAQASRFFCPCHNGVFDPSGKATGGPPADAGQSLARYDLKLEGGLLFIRVPLEGLAGPADLQGPEGRKGRAGRTEEGVV